MTNLTALLSRVRKLPLTEDTWECGFWLGRTWITEHRQPPYRAHIFMVVSSHGIPHVELSKPAYSADDVLEYLLRAMLKPIKGSCSPQRPTHVCCADAELVAQLAPRLAELGIACAVSSPSAEWQFVQRDLEFSLNNGEELLAGLASIPGASLALQGHFYELAADYYTLAPWHRLTDADPLEIRCPATSSPRYAVMLGSGGEIFGLAVYDTMEQACLILSGEELPGEEASQNVLILFFEEPTSMTFDDLDAITENGWTLASPQAYPILGRSAANNIQQPPLADLVWMEGALAAIVCFIREHLQMDGHYVFPADLTLPVQTLNGTIDVALRLPAFDNPKLHFVYDIKY